MRRFPFFVAVAVALVCTTVASAGFQPVRRNFGELQIPRVRAGTVSIPKRGDGRVTVIVTLDQPPLASVNRPRTLFRGKAASRLDARSATARAYLARLDLAQTAAAAAIRRAIPQATFGRRFGIVLDGLTVRVPAARLPALYKVAAVKKVYPSGRYTLNLDESPSLVGATAFVNRTGAKGDGVKIAVVDDGIDQKSTFFDPTAFTYPSSFPRGQTDFTTPKVIVARSYPGPGAGEEGKLPLDRRASFHGTHVAGIAAGNAGTTAPAGPDHPEVKGLTGVAPRAWLGNYRVFNTPTPAGNSAFTPQIVAAFEDAVSDGMDVINFSGGGPMNDPENDALVEAVHNVAAAGVVPVISAGNDRDDFGLGSVGAPGTAPDSISVAAVSNTHVFGPAMTVAAPGGLKPFPFNPGSPVPAAWGTSDQKLVDVGTIVGTDGKAVDRYLCGPPGNLEAVASTLPSGSLTGAIALVSRGYCTFTSKAERAHAAGAAAIVYVDNRPGEANGVPVDVGMPAGMIADADGAALRAAVKATGGVAMVRVGRQVLEQETGRGGTPTSFSSAGLTPFSHDLKPDLAAPGGEILSSTVPETVGEPYAVFAGTSMAAPHVAGAAALLFQRHPGWSAYQVKSALMATAGPAWGDTNRTSEASVLLQGAGLIDVNRADDPLLFTDPQSLSFHYLNVNRGAAYRTLAVTVADVGGGYGTWSVELRPQSATEGAVIDLPATLTIGPGGYAVLTAVARASAAAVAGDDYGFIVLKRGADERRIPYEFTVERPALEALPAKKLAAFQTGDTSKGESKVSSYRFPAAPFGPPADYTGPATDETGAEQLYVTELAEPAVNMGVAVILQSPGSLIDPFFLASKDENDVTGYTGTPVNVNGYMFSYRADVQAAGIQFPRQGQYYVAVDSGHSDFNGDNYAGQYFLHAWVNDVLPPLGAVVTRTVAAGRPTIVLRTADLGAGVDPLSLVFAYGETLVGAAAYDPLTGFALFPLPPTVPSLRSGKTSSIFLSSDFQEDKNVDQAGGTNAIMPNTAFIPQRLEVVNHPTVDWLFPDLSPNECLPAGRVPLLVVAGATRPIAAVRFTLDGGRIAAVTKGTAGLYSATWNRAGVPSGRHTLLATVTDTAGATATQARVVRVCSAR